MKLTRSLLRRMIIEETKRAVPQSKRRLVDVLFEAAENPETLEKLSDLLEKQYPEFVAGLISLQNDPDFIEMMASGSGGKDDALVLSTPSPAVKDLFPMQNIIGLDDSLLFELKKPRAAEQMAAGGTFGPEVYDYASRWIITAGDKYLVDGHHRWSTVYMLNPSSAVSVKNITNFPEGSDALKVSQLIIAALKPGVSMARPKGINVFSSEDKSTKEFILSNMSDAFAEAFSKGSGMKADKSAIADKIVENINVLKSENSPSKTGQGASQNDRTIMPQYDDGGTYIDKAAAGDVNLSAVKSALNAESRQSGDNLIMERWQRLAGILK